MNEKPNEAKNTQKIIWMYFVLSDYSWTWDHPWSVIDKLSVTILEKTNFPFSDRYQP